jgi:hypothetical protein
MDERLRFVGRLLDGEATTDVCREFGISRKPAQDQGSAFRCLSSSAMSPLIAFRRATRSLAVSKISERPSCRRPPQRLNKLFKVQDQCPQEGAIAAGQRLIERGKCAKTGYHFLCRSNLRTM